MPRGDRSGPSGNGPMTGRGNGFCAGYSAPGYAGFIPGRAGAGRGWRNRYFETGMTGWQRGAQGPISPYAPGFPPAFRFEPTPMKPEHEADALRNQVRYLQDNIKAAQDRISELENKESE